MTTELPLRVLIVDDNDLTRSLLQIILRGAKFDVVGEAATAAEGLSTAKSLRPDIVLLDNNMPGGNGIDIVKPLRTALPKSMILMVTTNSEDEVIQSAMRQGANGFVVKPFNTMSVIQTINDARKHFVFADPAAPRL
jgi:DNA-binding NarL/FixJ family response regulator